YGRAHEDRAEHREYRLTDGTACARAGRFTIAAYDLCVHRMDEDLHAFLAQEAEAPAVVRMVVRQGDVGNVLAADVLQRAGDTSGACLHSGVDQRDDVVGDEERVDETEIHTVDAVVDLP